MKKRLSMIDQNNPVEGHDNKCYLTIVAINADMEFLSITK